MRQSSLGELQGNAVNKPDFSGEDSAWESWMSTRKSLEEKVQDAERALEDAEDEKEKALEDAQRNLEDSLRSEQSDSTLGLYQLDLEEAGEELKRLKGILEQEGVVKADASGVVTVWVWRQGSRHRRGLRWYSRIRQGRYSLR